MQYIGAILFNQDINHWHLKIVSKKFNCEVRYEKRIATIHAKSMEDICKVITCYLPGIISSVAINCIQE